jgi:hypothetical protein
MEGMSRTAAEARFVSAQRTLTRRRSRRAQPTRPEIRHLTPPGRGELCERAALDTLRLPLNGPRPYRRTQFSPIDPVRGLGVDAIGRQCEATALSA